jgi:DinB superfamily
MSTPALDSSRDRVLGTAADGGIVLAHATATRAVAAWTLAPAQRDPVRHLEVAHAQAREHLGRLTVHDPAREVPSVMTNELFSRLTDARPAPLTAPAGVGRYTYTPRKALRRVLDHALDHLNQIDQWLAWQRRGIVPTPTDGWVPSTVTLPDDRLPLAPADLDAWLWRIDQAVRLVVQRAAELSLAELDWLPPDGGWPLRRVLHHLARSERLYAAALDEALPGDDPSRRYEEACRRLDEGVRVARSRDRDASIVYASLYGTLQTPEEVVGLVLAIEGELLAGAP